MIISIDIGTSYSTVCLLNAEGRAEPVETSTGISIYGSKYSLPSAVFVEEDGKVLVGQAAMNSRKRMPQNFRSEFKRDLGQNIPIVLGGRSFLPEELYTEMFRHLKACAQRSGKGDIEKAVITYPASYGKAKREKIKQAAKNAGMFDTELLDEPTAAAMCYGAKGCLNNGDILLVYDFGGGTFDASVIQYADGSYEPLAPAMGIEHCGGIDIDRAIYADMMSKIDAGTLQQLSANKTNKMRFEGQLAELAVKIKHHLSAAEYVKEAIPVGFDILDYELDRGKLNALIADNVSQTLDCCRNILDSAGIEVRDISGILLVGGTSRVPLVQEMLRKFAGDVPIHTDADPDLAVAMGALEEAQGDKNTVEWYKKRAERGDADAQYHLGLMHENGQDVMEDDAQTAEWYRKAAEQGDADAQFNLGVMYNNGEGVMQDYAKAVEWYRKAAEQGVADAQCNLGVMYANGRGVKQDDAKAVEWYHKAAEQGNASAQFNLGVKYENGEGVKRNYAKAVKWYRKAAEQGNASAQFNLGVIYQYGEGVRQDYAKAVGWYRKAAEQGDAAAQCNLGVMYNNGEGVRQDYAQAVEWYRKAAEQGNASAQFNLGVMYANGRGVKQDDAKAVEWYHKAAEQGNASAQFNLGVKYENGEGVKQDDAKAVEWYRKAAEQGDADAQCNLGVMYGNGQGVKRNYAKAVKWYQKAAEQGNAVAQCNLGVMYKDGKGVKQDNAKAAKWCRKAAEQGDARAQNILDGMYGIRGLGRK